MNVSKKKEKKAYCNGLNKKKNRQKNRKEKERKKSKSNTQHKHKQTSKIFSRQFLERHLIFYPLQYSKDKEHHIGVQSEGTLHFLVPSRSVLLKIFLSFDNALMRGGGGGGGEKGERVNVRSGGGRKREK